MAEIVNEWEKFLPIDPMKIGVLIMEVQFASTYDGVYFNNISRKINAFC
jgi:hypothetical protein